MELGWRIVLATTGIPCSRFRLYWGALLVAASSWLFLVPGFDIKSSSAMSNCIVMATEGVTTYLNLKGKKTNYIHPTFQPLINYNLVLLIHPMLLLGVGIGVTFIVILAEWMLTLLLFIIFLGTKQYPFP